MVKDSDITDIIIKDDTLDIAKDLLDTKYYIDNQVLWKLLIYIEEDKNNEYKNISNKIWNMLGKLMVEEILFQMSANKNKKDYKC